MAKDSTRSAGYINRHARKLNGAPEPPRMFRPNSVPEGKPWVWMELEMIESEAFRRLSIYGNRALFRIIIEHLHQGGRENGRLKVTWSDLEKCGIHRRRIEAAVDEIIASGLVRITVPGRAAHGADKGAPAQFALTWLPIIEPNNLIPAPNSWRRRKPDSTAKVFPLVPPLVPDTGPPVGTG